MIHEQTEQCYGCNVTLTSATTTRNLYRLVTLANNSHACLSICDEKGTLLTWRKTRLLMRTVMVMGVSLPRNLGLQIQTVDSTDSAHVQ